MATQRKYYVYVYFDPETYRPIYVGKGCGHRALRHLKSKNKKSPKVKAIREIEGLGKKPIIQIVQWNMTEDEALKVESALLECFGIRQLTNAQRGRGVDKVNADFIDYILNDGVLRIKRSGRKRVLLLSVNGVYQPGMSAFELYDAVRGPWGVRPEKVEDCVLILCVYYCHVIEVYSNATWFDAGSGTRLCLNDECEDGFEFMARQAGSVTRKRYIGKEVKGVNLSKGFTYGWID